MVIAVQEQPGYELLGSELPCYRSPFLEPYLPESALGLNALEPPGSYLLGLDLSVLGLDWPGFELLPGDLAMLLEMVFGQGLLRLPLG